MQQEVQNTSKQHKTGKLRTAQLSANTAHNTTTTTERNATTLKRQVQPVCSSTAGVEQVEHSAIQKFSCKTDVPIKTASQSPSTRVSMTMVLSPRHSSRRQKTLVRRIFRNSRDISENWGGRLFTAVTRIGCSSVVDIITCCRSLAKSWMRFVLTDQNSCLYHSTSQYLSLFYMRLPLILFLAWASSLRFAIVKEMKKLWTM